jgi:outer membrane protein assembly factor BamB
MLFFGSDDNKLYALEAKSGTLLWRYPTRGDLSTPVIYEDLLYVGSLDARLYAFRIVGE